MNQEKIGKFISSCRKKQNLTQEQLAEKLGITYKAVSKWETGKGLPDPSIMIGLCNILKITVNELLSGEKIEKEQYQNKFEENIVNTFDYANKKAKKIINKFALSGIVIGIVVLALITMFVVDVNRMRTNQPVIFSTWGFKYYPAINLNEEKIELAIRDYIVDKGDNSKRYENEKTFASMKIYLIHDKETEVDVYAWVLDETYYMEQNVLKQNSGSSMAYKFVVKKINDEYEVVDSRNPRDGSYYVDDMKNIFPKSVRKEMDDVHHDGTIEKLQLDIKQQMKLYFHQ